MSTAAHDTPSPRRTRGRGQALTGALELSGRLLLGVLFLVSGAGKISAYDATEGYMQAMGVPFTLLPAVIVLEVVGALLLFVGWKTKFVAILLAGFSIISALLFHANIADQIQLVMLLKNLSIAGGLLVLAANGAGPYSVDARQ